MIRRRLAHNNPVRSLRRRRRARRVEIREAEALVRIPERQIVRALLTAAEDLTTIHLFARNRVDAGFQTVETRRVSASHPIRAMRSLRTAYPNHMFGQFRATPWLRPLLSVLALAGRRIGEARGLRWRSVRTGEIRVCEAVDRYNTQDVVKTVAALRTIPIGPQLSAILDAWRPDTSIPDDLVFPSERGTPLG